jgi:hypothetical protein
MRGRGLSKFGGEEEFCFCFRRRSLRVLERKGEEGKRDEKRVHDFSRDLILVR